MSDRAREWKYPEDVELAAPEVEIYPTQVLAIAANPGDEEFPWAIILADRKTMFDVNNLSFSGEARGVTDWTADNYWYPKMWIEICGCLQLRGTSARVSAAPSLDTAQRDQPKEGDIATLEDNFGYEDVVPNRCDKCGEICGLKHVCDSSKADAARIGEIRAEKWLEINGVEDIDVSASTEAIPNATQLVSELMESYSAYLLAELERLRHNLCNLLAIIHRDGGHKTGELGLEESVNLAHKVWAELITKADEAERLRGETQLKRRLDDMASSARTSSEESDL